MHYPTDVALCRAMQRLVVDGEPDWLIFGSTGIIPADLLQCAFRLVFTEDECPTLGPAVVVCFETLGNAVKIVVIARDAK